MIHLLNLDFVDSDRAINNLTTNPPQIIGLYFGSFDPFHNGHMEVLEVMLNYVDIILITTADKNSEKPLLSLSKHRAQMIQNHLSQFSIPAYFIRNDLITTINKLQSSFHLCGIMGSDVYLKFISQNRIPRMKVDEWFIIPRADSNNRFDDDYPIVKCEPFNKTTTLLNKSLFKKQGFSSTQIRNALKIGKLNNLPLSELNIRYIKDHKLYGISNM
ncbi:Cytidylyltransferase [uncultured virus]|nr:Cytidylyltransferase [uncultured virus]